MDDVLAHAADDDAGFLSLRLGCDFRARPSRRWSRPSPGSNGVLGDAVTRRIGLSHRRGGRLLDRDAALVLVAGLRLGEAAGTPRMRRGRRKQLND